MGMTSPSYIHRTKSSYRSSTLLCVRPQKDIPALRAELFDSCLSQRLPLNAKLCERVRFYDTASRSFLALLLLLSSTLCRFRLRLCRCLRIRRTRAGALIRRGSVCHGDICARRCISNGSPKTCRRMCAEPCIKRTDSAAQHSHSADDDNMNDAPSSPNDIPSETSGRAAIVLDSFSRLLIKRPTSAALVVWYFKHTPDAGSYVLRVRAACGGAGAWTAEVDVGWWEASALAGSEVATWRLRSLVVLRLRIEYLVTTRAYARVRRNVSFLCGLRRRALKGRGRTVVGRASSSSLDCSYHSALLVK